MDMVKSNSIFLRVILPWTMGFGLTQFIFIRLVTMERPYLSAVYFIAISIGLFLIFQSIYSVHFKSINKRHILAICALLLSHIAIYLLSNAFTSESYLALRRYHVSFLQVNEYFLWAIPINVINQQLFLILLFYNLKKIKFDQKHVIAITVGLFALAHVYQILRIPFLYASYFVISATIGAVLLPIIYRLRKDGFFINILLHLMFYDVSALLFWIVVK